MLVESHSLMNELTLAKLGFAKLCVDLGLAQTIWKHDAITMKLVTLPAT
jgi:hypothetical protein